MKQRIKYGSTGRHGLTACVLLAILAAGCAAPPLREKTEAPAPTPEPEYANIRIALMQYENTVQIAMEEGTINSDTQKMSFQSPQTLTADRSFLNCAGESVELPATIYSSRPLRIGEKSYYGHLLIQDGYVINIIPVDVYTVGVLHGEVPASWPMEVLKAQAVVSRTYAYGRIMHQSDELFHAGSTEMYQKYEYGEGSAAIEQAVMSTSNEILLYQDQPIEVFFHACSGGRTENSRDVFQKDLPYLRSIPDPYCARDERFAWTFTADSVLIGQALIDMGAVKGQSVSAREIRIRSRTGSGRVREFLVSLEGGEEVLVQGNQLRLALDPKSFKSLLITEIDRERTGGETRFVFHGRGYGHGVGMSQWGAKAMADQGFSYRHILAHYYPGTRIGMVWDIR